jgi:cysteinyl-tRNA synthetase
VNQSNNNITKLSDTKNWVYVINPGSFASPKDYVNKMAATNFDIMLITPFWNKNTLLTPSQIKTLKRKSIGAKRIVLCYVSIGEAENFFPY